MHTYSVQSRSSMDTVASRDDRPHGFSQAISEAFEPYMSLWVESQDKYVRNTHVLTTKLTLQATCQSDTKVPAATPPEFRGGFLPSSCHILVDRIVPILSFDLGTVCQTFDWNEAA
jgi:hypothetical protein